MDPEPVFMVRDATFGANFTPKLVVSVLTVGLVAWDVAARRRRDYLWVFVVGTVAWTAIELSLHLRGTRIMPAQLLFGQDLPLPVAALLQGMAEGAFVAVLGLFVADRLRDPATRAQAVLGFLLGLAVMWLLMAIQAAGTPGAEPAGSHRNMTALAPLLTLLAVVAFDGWFWWRRPQFRSRSVTMAAVMLVFATVWTVADVSTGGRWVEIAGAAPGTFAAAPPLTALLALAFDVGVEITLAYVPFFAVPALLGLIQPERRAPSSSQAAAARAGD